jgi:hypothetical protein
MTYIKSGLVGVLAMSIATIGYVLVSMVIMLRKYPLPPGAEVGFNLRTLIGMPSYWLIALAAFGLGFYLQFRRAG